MALILDGTNTPTLGGVGYGDGSELAFTGAGTAGQVLTSAGGAAPTWGAAPSPPVANQAEMEAASSSVVFATPSNLNWHPGVAKMWLKCNAAGAIQASLNVASITDSGTGYVTVTLTTSFSSSNYSVIGTPAASAGNQPRFIFIVGQAAGSFAGICDDQSGTNTDPLNWFFVAFGDQ